MNETFVSTETKMNAFRKELAETTKRALTEEIEIFHKEIEMLKIWIPLAGKEKRIWKTAKAVHKIRVQLRKAIKKIY